MEDAEDVGNEDEAVPVDEVVGAANETVDKVDGAADWTDEEMDEGVRTIDDDVEITDELVVWEVETVTPNWYISSSDGPPQYSEWSPGQIISHPVPSGTRAPPFSMSLPHQHSVTRLVWVFSFFGIWKRDLII
jgi:hypothetical protein